MNLCETFFVVGKPIGTIRQDSNTEQFYFAPVRGKSPLPVRDWESVDQLKQAVLAAYGGVPPAEKVTSEKNGGVPPDETA